MSSTPQHSPFAESTLKTEFEIRPPSPPPAPPAINLMLLLLPGVFMGLSAIAMLLVALTSAVAPAQLLMNFAMVGFMLMSVLTSWLNYRFQQQQYEQTATERRERYLGYLNRCEAELKDLLDAHVRQRLARFPSPIECYQIVMRREAALWQRDTRHGDFLVLRCGLGTLHAPVEVKLQEPDPNQPQDDLFNEAQRVKAQARSVSNAPVVLPVSTLNIVGLIGAPRDVQPMAAGWIAQIAALHGPGSVYVAGALPLNDTQGWHWRWLRWLPHVWTPGRSHCLLAATARDIAERVDELCRAFATPSASEQEAGLQPHVVILVDLDAVPSANEILRRLVASRPNVHLIAMASSSDSLPRECNWIVECSPQKAILRRVQPMAATDLRPDSAPEPGPMEVFAELLMRFWEQQSEEGGAESPGETVTLFQLWESQSQRIYSVRDIDVARAWQRNRPFERNSQTLAVPIGRDESGNLVHLNLHDRDDPRGQPSHGPHGLVAGATGSGKSELLQSLIASLAAHFSPQVLSFLLVDYKGGGTADVFRDMPHVAGIITNLADESLSQRALLALQSEIQRRQERFQTIGVNYIDDYQRHCAQDRNLPPLPRLVIIVDEFAELAQNQPEFIRQLVRTARVGRSLGVHLILATQKPSGVVNEQIWSNSRFRICLRVESPSDSNEMLKRPDAARLTRSGQAYLQVGSGELFLRFQAAYANAPYIEGGAGLPEPVFEVELNGRRRRLNMPDAVRSKAPEQTQLVALVSHICDTAQQLKLRKVDSIWIPPLPDPREEPLALLDKAHDQLRVKPLFYPADSGWDESKQEWRPARRWLSPLVGLMDDPRERRQERLYIPLDDPPTHLLVYGMPSSGKTTFLLTLALSLAMDHTPEEIHLYALDFGARALSVLREFPHTADVIARGETEKVVRLFRWLQAEAERRRQHFNQVGVSNFRAYLELRQRDPSHPALPAVVVLIDGYPTFAEAHPEQETQLEQLMRECAGQGIHFVIVGGSATSIKPRISSNAALTVTFQQTDPGDYASIVGRAAIRPAALPGRGLVRRSPPLEFQTALPVRTESEAEQTELLRALGGRMRAAWRGATPGPIRTLPEVLPLCELLEQGRQTPGEGEPPIALTTDTLSLLRVPMKDGLHFLIYGPPGGGKTTLLLSWLVAMAEWHPPDALRLFMCDLDDFAEEGLSMISALPHRKLFAQGIADLEPMLTELDQEISQRQEHKGQLQDAPTIILALDNLSKLKDTTPPPWLATQMSTLVRQSKDCKFHILASIGEDALTRVLYNQTWLGTLRGRFLVGAAQSSAMSLRVPPGEAQRATPAGFGYFSAPNLPLATRVKFANPFVGSLALPQWVEVIAQRYANNCKPAQ
ncbi:MAG: type VII secretion protein EssC [Chloroflexi bacterium]|jgi:S-DNA-T family DNA segregation ATPase FtsK/SpoIIIE|uniref:type VII secretion protein EssC n=1 Tax=Candidatus Roseilinea sp. NK_OTU-006 TaxID=2704250 RepID=UPI000F0EB03D|nr:type VII secretion protein EssC [Candidatus Roseilinea sp. NK_OTU-006]RMG62989.1 MAG: type VII secretion protein EssC [Chloroflexota bacterium]